METETIPISIPFDEARKVLVEEMGGTLFTVAKDVKLQVEFNPAIVKGYRLIGYENRIMNAEDFADDTKDGGEIGAGHRVTALYEIVKIDSAYNMSTVKSKYTKNEVVDTIQNSMENEWLTVNIRYKEPMGNSSELLTYPVGDTKFHNNMSDNMSFAAGVAQFGMILRESDYAGATTLKDVRERLKELPTTFLDEYKEEFIYLMSRA